jgi:hypothetical protein
MNRLGGLRGVIMQEERASEQGFCAGRVRAEYTKKIPRGILGPYYMIQSGSGHRRGGLIA